MEALIAIVILIALSRSNSASEETTVEPSSIVALETVTGHYLDREAARAFDKAVRESSVPRVTSSFRTRAEQEYLYQLFLSGKGNLAAKPGTSKHEFGLAIDARGTVDWEAAMTANGFRRTVSSEPWHWEYFGG